MAFTASNAFRTSEAMGGSGSRTRSNSPFIPELWADELLATYKSNLVMAPLVHTLAFHGQKGDTVHVPRPVRQAASALTEATEVTITSTDATQTNYLIDTHWHYAVLISDLAKIQADDSMRAFYTNDAGYQLAAKVDSDLHDEGAKFAGSDASPTVEGSAYSKAVIGTPSAGSLVTWVNTGAGNEAVLTDEGIRLVIKELDDNNVPNANRVLVVPPSEKKNLLGIDRFTEQAFVGDGSSIRTGQIGNIYGTEVYVSTNCSTPTTTGTSTNQRAALMFHKDAIVFIEQLAPRVQADYMLNYVSTLMVADQVFGSGVLRPEAGVAIVVPA